jgi:hypothetical protein
MVILEKLTVTQPVKKPPVFYGTQGNLRKHENGPG